MSGNQIPLIFLILAQDEENVLERSLCAVSDQLGEDDELHVVADHCRDHTVEIARSYGAIVHVRHDNGPTGKAAALGWWVKRQNIDPSLPVVIIDADSEVLPGFADQLRHTLRNGAVAAQAALIAELPDESPIGRLIALSERMDQTFFDRFRYRIGGSIRLRGTGMALRFALLQRYTPLLHTKTEDVELALMLANDRVRVIPAFDAKLIDPKPYIPEGAMNQRARWLQGQMEILRSYPDVIFRLLFRNPLGFSLVTSALIKPRSIFTGFRMFACLTAIVGLMLGSSPMGLLVAFVSVSVILNLPDLLGLSYALWTSPNRRRDFGALAALPSFLILWIRSITRARLSRSPWLRVRPIPVAPDLNETATASN